MRVRSQQVNPQDFNAIVLRLAALELKVAELSKALKAGKPAKDKNDDPS
jgi:hypothetical protein